MPSLQSITKTYCWYSDIHRRKCKKLWINAWRTFFLLGLKNTCTSCAFCSYYNLY